MTCPKFGNQVFDGDAFCENCGFNLKSQSEEKRHPEAEREPRGKTSDKRIPQPKTKKNRSLLPITLVSVLIALVALGVIAYLTGFLSVILAFFQTTLGYVFFGTDLFWLIIALVAIVIIMITWNRIAPRITRSVRAKDYQKEREMTGQMLAIKTAMDKTQLQKALKKRLRLKYFFPKTSDPNIWHCHYPGKPLVAGRGDEFTACIYFDDSEVKHTVLYLEFLRWREKNGVTRKRGLKAMQGFIDSVWSFVKANDTSATKQVIER